MNNKNVKGVVLAGGKSSRMGENKALLDYKGKPLVRHMINILESTGLTDIYISGDLEGYNCIKDIVPRQGPAHAMNNILKSFHGHSGVIFIPIDMPLLSPDILNILLEQDNGGYFQDLPLPVFIKSQHSKKCPDAVKDLLHTLSVPQIPLSTYLNDYMANTNTPEDWKKILKA